MYRIFRIINLILDILNILVNEFLACGFNPAVYFHAKKL